MKTTRNIKNTKVTIAITACIFVIWFLVFSSFFFYLVGKHCPNIESHYYRPCIWTKGEKDAFITLIVFLGLSIIFIIFIGSDNGSVTHVPRVTRVSPQLIELNQIIYPDKNFDFYQLKTEVLNLKSKELEPKLNASQAQLTRLITQLQNKVDNDAKAIIDLYLQTHAQIIAQDKEKDTFAQGQLANFEDALQNNLTQEELHSLRKLQKETLDLEQHLNNLRGGNNGRN